MKSTFRYRGLREIFMKSYVFGTGDLEIFHEVNFSVQGTQRIFHEITSFRYRTLRELQRFFIRFSTQVRLHFFLPPFRARVSSLPLKTNFALAPALFPLIQIFSVHETYRFMRFSRQRGRYFIGRLSFPFLDTHFARSPRAFSLYSEMFQQIFDTGMVFLFCRAPFRTRGF